MTRSHGSPSVSAASSPGGAANAVEGRLQGAPLRKALRRSVWDAGFFGAMVGVGESYFLAAGVAVGGSPLELALLVSLPLFLGSLGPVGAVVLLRRASRRRPLVVASAILQALNLLLLAALQLAGAATPRVLIASVCLHQVAGMAAGTLWSSWYGDLVPEALRGRYFAQRNRATQTALFVSLGLAGWWLHWSSGGGRVSDSATFGFAALFAVAGLARAASAVALWRSPESRFGGLASLRTGQRFFQGGRGQRARRVLTLGGVMQFFTYIASPFFIPFMLRELEFTYLEFMIATASVIAAKLWLLPAWGQQIDRHGAGAVFRAAVILIALVPLPWVFIHDLWWVVLAQALSGASWACYELAFFSLLVEATFRRTRPYVFAGQNLINGSAQLLGSLLGAALVGPFGLSFRTVFAVSTALRIAAALALLPRLKSESHGEGKEGRPHRIVLRAIGFRPGGGVALRPVRWMVGESRRVGRRWSERQRR